MKKMRVDILIPNFEDLGAQRVAINIANSLSKIYSITFIVLEDKGPFKSYLEDNIPIFDLSKLAINIPKVRVFTKMMSYANWVQKNKTNISISFSPITNFYILYAKYKNPFLKTIIQEHAYPSVALKDRGNSSLFYEILFKYFLVKFYNKSDVFLTIANAIKDDFITNFNIRDDFFEIVRNPLDIDKIENLLIEKIDNFVFQGDKKYLIGVGRLANQKNFKFLIEILYEIRKQNKNIELIILGKGELENELKSLSKSLNIDKYVHFLGFQKNPYKYMTKSNIFCLTSMWEGLPQVLAEAMICKLPIVSHKCKSGPDEMIENNKTGILVDYNNKKAFVDSILKLLENENFSQEIKLNAFKYAKKEYSLENSFRKYKNIIKELS
jgi:glycosyltransferase involved in cell wall biosynthesis